MSEPGDVYLRRPHAVVPWEAMTRRELAHGVRLALRHRLMAGDDWVRRPQVFSCDRSVDPPIVVVTLPERGNEFWSMVTGTLEKIFAEIDLRWGTWAVREAKRIVELVPA